MKNIGKRIFKIFLVVLLVFIIVVVCKAVPIISGYGAKNLASGVFVAGRSVEDLQKNELNAFLINLGTFTIDMKDSSATGSVFGFAKKKAIYRKGLGVTVINGLTEDELRHQNIIVATPPIINQDTIDWPNGNRIKDTNIAGVNKQVLNTALQKAFTEPGDKLKRRVRSILVVYNGQIVAEQYALGFTVKTKQLGWSMTKSITNALIGILVKQGKLNVNDPVLIDVWKNDKRNKITVNDLMHMSSGLKWDEGYGGPSDVTNMLFKEKDMADFTLQAPLADAPDAKFNYSSGSTNILSLVTRKIIGDKEYYKFPYEQLFYKTGMLSAVMEPDASGTFVGSSYSYATARDWARFGMLYLNDGVWNGERILPEGWVKYTTTPANAAEQGNYGALWWLNAGTKGNAADRKYPHVPTDCFMCIGHDGQNIWVIPSKKLVIVRLSLQQGNKLNEDEFLSDVIKGIEK